MFDLQSVAQALLLAEHLSVRQTADQLGLRPSAVSRRVRALEEQLKGSLFERHSAGVRVTPAGRRFLDRARLAMTELDNAERDATLVERGDGGALGIAFYPSLASGRLHDLLGAYRMRFPDLALSFLKGASMDQLVALRHHQVDVAFLTAVDDAPGAANEHLWDERIYIALSSTKGPSFSFAIPISSTPVRLHHQVTGDDHADREAGPDRDRRLNLKRSPNDLPPGLTNAVGRAAPDRLEQLAFVVPGPGLRAHRQYGREQRRLEQCAPVLECVNPKLGEVVCDPACGTAGFLLAAHDHLQFATRT